MSSSATPRSTVAKSAIPLRTPSSEMNAGQNQDSRPRLFLNPHHSHPSSSYFRDTDQFSPPTSASTSSAYSPISESPTSDYYHSLGNSYHSQQQQQQRHQQQQHRLHHFQQGYSQSSSSSLPADSFPRTHSKSIVTDKERFNYEQLPNSSSTYAPQRSRYQLHHQPSYPPISSSVCDELSTLKDINIHSSDDTRSHSVRDGQSNSFSDIRSALPEYSYPMTSSQRVYRDYHHLPYSDVHSSVDQGYSQGSYSRNSQNYPNDLARSIRYHQSERHQPKSAEHLDPTSQKSRLSIYTSWNSNSTHNFSNQSLSARSTDSWISPTTPRSMQVATSALRPSVSDTHTIAESPVDFCENSDFQHSAPSPFHVKSGYRDSEMMSYSEQDNPYGHDQDDENPYDESDSFQAKKQKKGIYEPMSSSRGKLPVRGRKANAPSRSRPTRRASSLEDAHDQIDDEAIAASQATVKGLRVHAQRVCSYVEAKGSTSYNELVFELFGIGNGDGPPDGSEPPAAQDNVRRRVYDALNVLEATGIIAYAANKDIHWVGMGESGVIPSSQDSKLVPPSRLPGGGKDDESEEPEDDDMDIEKLQKEIHDLRLQNERELAQLGVQVARHAQITSLVKRNKRCEDEREERRRLRKEERRRARAIDEESSMVDVGPQFSSDQNDEVKSKPEGSRRRRSSRGVPERRKDKENLSGDDDQEEDEDARRRRKKERKERRERKAQKKLEKENNKVPLPFILLKMPKYVGQSSDSESNISVIRQVCRRSPGQSENALQEETTVGIHISHEDPIIMSDTEILEDLGF
ncbi:hypothetical protein BGZ76_008440 [Entomortierella beljakovae]|nr:hypothetical protein BGZ76_008440 [Entomortierella beljakovae]